jgi:hypothetical protein
MKIYVRFKQNGSDVFSVYSGLSEETVLNLLQERGCVDVELITESEYQATVGAH